MRKSLLAAVSLVTASLTMFAAAVGPAAADPASAAGARAVGLEAVGLLAISETIVTQATLPPGQDTTVEGGFGSPSLLTVPLGNLALAGAAGVNASAHQADDISPVLTAANGIDDTTLEEPVELSPVNARGYAETAGAGVLLSSADVVLDPILDLLQLEGGLLTTDVIAAEAVARCVNNQPVFDTGFQVIGLGGAVGGGLDDLVQTLLTALETAGLIGAGAVLEDIISVQYGVVTPIPNGVSVAGLVIDLLNGTETVVLAQAEATMPAGCGVAAAPPPAVDAGPGGRLASTGTDVPLLPIGAALMGAAAVTYGVVRRSRRTAAE